MIERLRTLFFIFAALVHQSLFEYIILEMTIIILNFNQILNLVYYDILCSSDKGKVFPLSELQKIPPVKTQAVKNFIYLPFIFIYIHSLNVFIYLLVDLYSEEYLVAYITHEPIFYIIVIGQFSYILIFT